MVTIFSLATICHIFLFSTMLYLSNTFLCRTFQNPYNQSSIICDNSSVVLIFKAFSYVAGLLLNSFSIFRKSFRKS